VTHVDVCGCSEERLITSLDWLFGSTPMLDVVMLAIGLGFFALSVGYCYACDRL
jgi:hypothetical protein